MPFRSFSVVLTLSTTLALVGCATTERPPQQAIDAPIPPAAAGVYDISAVTNVPVATRQVRPHYPRDLRAAGISGEAVVLLTVTAQGDVVDTSVVRATDARFGQAAMDSVRQWKFRAAKLNGVEVPCRMMVPIMFDVSGY